ncbi:HNH endonuclease [Euhalothece natronophila Z-M001]|uniref:HNH endonuclease n=1 Tax=Euhalothece natronophila Z-M001 TaxID=522448 RepID=A0A5B8NU38_9CHRO|nr:HNH endonuclease [Euhalothece natronophila Z-M001]
MFLLNIYDQYEDNKISLDKFLKILQYLESYFVRRLFVSITTKNLGSIFTKLYSQIKNYDDIVEGLHITLSEFEGNKRWPDDEEFRKHFVKFNLYNQNQRDRTKLILESLESWNNKEEVNPNNLTIEHIMPQKLNKPWEKMLGNNYDSIHKKCLHTVGNLTLTAYNSELSDKAFQDKKELLIRSNISLNRYFQNVSVWNEQEIQRRAHNLADKAVKIWPR